MSSEIAIDVDIGPSCDVARGRALFLRVVASCIISGRLCLVVGDCRSLLRDLAVLTNFKRPG